MGGLLLFYPHESFYPRPLPGAVRKEVWGPHLIVVPSSVTCSVQSGSRIVLAKSCPDCQTQLTCCHHVAACNLCGFLAVCHQVALDRSDRTVAKEAGATLYSDICWYAWYVWDGSSLRFKYLYIVLSVSLPSKVLLNWVKELKTWTPGARIPPVGNNNQTRYTSA